jgi:hypothetical protein
MMLDDAELPEPTSDASCYTACRYSSPHRKSIV